MNFALNTIYIFEITFKNPSFLLKNIEIYLFLKSISKPHPQSC